MSRAILGAAVCVAIGVVTVGAGGWAVTTVNRMPDHAVVGQPFRLEFTVRQHGHTLAPGLTGPVRARLDGRIVEATTRPGPSAGTYVADVTLGVPGTWELEIALWGRAVVQLPVVRFRTDVRPVALTEQGRRLFTSKGCVTCHAHAAVDVSASIGYGPGLTGRRYPAELLTAKLVTPTPCSVDAFAKPCMPVLGLTDNDVRALGAFLNAEPAAAANHTAMRR